MIGLLIVLAVLQIADVVTTAMALSRGRREANPIIARMVVLFGKFWWVPKLAIGAVAIWLLWTDGGPLATVGAGLLVALYLWVVWSNLRRMKR